MINLKGKSKSKIYLSIILLATIIIVLIVSNQKWNKDKAVVIVDENGKEYYKLTEQIEIKEENNITIKDNWFADSVINKVIDDLVSKGYSKKKAIKEINNGSLIIESTVNIEMQNMVNDVYRKRESFTDRKKGDINQSSIVIMDYQGNIKALAGGNGENSVKNRATITPLKIGSTIKPISIYTPAIDEDLIHFSSIIDDSSGITYVNGKSVKWPQNYDNKYDINVTISEALQKSKNTIAVNVGRMVGNEKIFKFLKDEVGYTTLVGGDQGETDKQLSALSLGYLVEGITLDKLVASYSMFGNEGKHSNPKTYTMVKNKKGKIILENKEEEKQVISSETASIMNRLLLNNINGEESIAKSAKIPGIEVLGKTGTVGDDKKNTTSQLFVGMTPEYIGGVWVGNENKSPLLYNTYKSPISIWKSIFEKIEIEKKEFEINDSIIEEEYCEITGLIKSNNCKRISIGYYKPLNIPEVCNICN